MIVLGLTGSIGMGKSVTAAMFAEAGVPVFDADAVVHGLYGPGGAAVPLVEAAFPGVAVEGSVSRARLAERVLNDSTARERLESLVHPLVASERRRFLEQAKTGGADVAVLDIPLLFETGAEDEADAVVVVSAPPEVHRARVLARPDMTEARLEAILALQLPDAEKRRRADFVIDTGRGLELARRQVAGVLSSVRSRDFTPTFAGRGKRAPASPDG